MKADALDKGLDLDDPAVLKILQKLQVLRKPRQSMNP
jgi:hypothetical protein